MPNTNIIHASVIVPSVSISAQKYFKHSITKSKISNGQISNMYNCVQNIKNGQTLKSVLN